MRHSVRKTLGVATMALSVIAASAQEKVIDGYFRIQTLAGAASNNNYVEVTGPFTARPDLSFSEARERAGSVFYISAVQDGTGNDASYRLTNLRSQGIDASMDVVDADDYEQILLDAVNSSGSKVHALVRQGFKYGYTSVARATVGSVFLFVAAALEKYVPEGQTIEENAYFNVAKDFNREVVANLDLGIRLKPVEGMERTVQLYYDVPNLQAVCDWYLADDTEEHKARKATFESAMDAMTNFLSERHNTTFELFLPEDIALLENWGYDIKAAYPGMVESYDVDGTAVEVVNCNFRTIFADPDLLFNWIKMVGYMILNPEADKYDRFSSLGFGDLADKVNDHYLTSLLNSYLPRLRPDKRVFLINGRVLNDAGDITSSGNHWADSGNTLGFASESEVAIAGDHGKWVITPIDNDTQAFAVESRLNEVDGKHYAALYLDFPVLAQNSSVTRFYTLSEEKVKSIAETDYTYTELVELEGTVAPHTPFILEIDPSQGTEAGLVIPNDGWVFKSLGDPVPDNSFIIGDDETTSQHSPVRRAAEGTTGNASMRGVLLATALTSDALTNYWGDDYVNGTPVYSFDHSISLGSATQMGFRGLSVTRSSGSLQANEAVYNPSKPLNENMLLIGEPAEPDTTGVEEVAADAADGDDVFYDMRGIRVVHPEPGKIYICNGRKVIVM